MKEFKQIYKILTILRENLDSYEPAYELLTPESTDANPIRIDSLLCLLKDAGLVEWMDDDGVVVKLGITLDGLQYLEENKMMRKASRILRRAK